MAKSKEERAAYFKAYYEANKERLNAYSRGYQRANKDKIKAYYRASKEKLALEGKVRVVNPENRKRYLAKRKEATRSNRELKEQARKEKLAAYIKECERVAEDFRNKNKLRF